MGNIKDIIEYIRNDAEIAIPIKRMFTEEGEHLTKKQYGLFLLDVLCKEQWREKHRNDNRGFRR